MDKNTNHTGEENILVHVIFRSVSGEPCECVGVLMHDTPESIVVAFSATQDVTIDSITIQKPEIISLKRITEKEIRVF